MSYENRDEYDLREQRQLRAAADWKAGKAKLGRMGVGCLVLAILAALAAAWLAGYVAGDVKCFAVRPERLR